MPYLFTKEINGWTSWGKVYQSLPDFAPLIRKIYQKEGIPCGKISRLTPGTNAVFRCGGTVVKIYAPSSSGIDSKIDFQVELFGLNRAERLGIPAPKLLASGRISDRYDFWYLIMEAVEGIELSRANLSSKQKEELGAQLCRIVQQLHTPCEACAQMEGMKRGGSLERWSGFSESFHQERLAYISQYPYSEKVYVHGDLTRDNLLLGQEGLVLIDFADASMAPSEYELAALYFEGFQFDPAYLRGFCGSVKPENNWEACFAGLLLHDFGAALIRDHVGDPALFPKLETLKEKVWKLFASVEGGR